jgi:predicted DNA-binding ribbon-helix-helix protein
MSSDVQRSIILHGRRTSISLEEPFWRAFRMIAAERKETVGELAAQIDSAREQNRNLSSAIRTFVLAYYVARDEGRSPKSTNKMSALGRIRRSKRNG